MYDGKVESAVEPERERPATDPPRGALAATRELPLAPERLGRLFESLRPRLFSVALGFTRCAETADDVVQSAFEKALRHREQFRGQARVSTWLHRIVANEALMWLRAERRRQRRIGSLGETEIEEIADPSPGPLAGLDARQAKRRLRECIATLGEDERDVLERCVLPGRSYAEYGAERGVHPAAAKSRAFRARRRLQTLLA